MWLMWGSLRVAASGVWEYDPPCMGRVQQGGEGAWMVSYSMGAFPAGSEFNIPLQLVYVNTRAASGLFGPQWFCPQLESTVLPREHGVLVWTQPSGMEVGFRADEKHAGEYVSLDEIWRMCGKENHWAISGEDGWEFVYDQGHLQTVFSPTRRALDFRWEGGAMRAVQLRAATAGLSVQTVLTVAGWPDRRVSEIQMAGQKQAFGYATNGVARLVMWQPAVGRPLQFRYDLHNGVLNSVERGEGARKDFRTVYNTAFST